MFDVAQKLIYVAGGAGEVGEGVVRAFLQQGARVVVSSRDPDKLARLKERLTGLPIANLHSVIGSAESEATITALRDRVLAVPGKLDGVVASLGGWWEGQPLLDVSLSTWHRLLDNSLTAHFLLARSFVPVLARRSGASYTLLNGGGALQPVPRAGPISVSAAAQIMLKDVLANELAENSPLRINTLLLGTPILTRSRASGPADWLTADEAGLYAVYLASRQARHVSGQTVHFKDRAQLVALVS